MINCSHVLSRGVKGYAPQIIFFTLHFKVYCNELYIPNNYLLIQNNDVVAMCHYSNFLDLLTREIV